MISRRTLVAGSLATSFLSGCQASRLHRDEDFIREALAALERRHGGRLGVAILDGGSDETISHRGGERFAFCSTIKALAAAFVLARVDQGRENLLRRIAYPKRSLVDYSPVTEKFADGPGLTMGEICQAAVTMSDNSAGNLMFDSFGGPAGLTRYLRSIGDAVTRSDRREPELNDVPPGDVRDTTSPQAMARTLRSLLTEPALSPASRGQLAAWLTGSRTGDRRLRAGALQGWRTSDKTGSGPNNITNDVAVFWPPEGAPIFVVAFYEGARASAGDRDAVLAEVGRLAVAAKRQRNLS